MKLLIPTALLVLFSSMTFTQEKSVEPFIPQIFSQFPNVRDIAISSERDEIYFSVQSYTDEASLIVTANKENNIWSVPEIASFSGKFFDLEPFLSTDGLTLFFASNRPLANTDNKAKDFDIWYVQRENKNSEWSAPINIGQPINSKNNEFYPSIANNKNLYFTSDAPPSAGKDNIFFSIWENGKYLSPVSLSDSINSAGYEFNAFIAPDESYLVFSGYQREGSFGSGDLYISYKISDSTWTKAKNLGREINSEKMDYCPFVDTNNNLYFTSKRTSVNDPAKTFSSVQDFLNEVSKYDNGLSRIYKTKIK